MFWNAVRSPSLGSSAVLADPPPTASSKVRLPKLTLQSFDGELTSWTPFWDAFKAAVHDNGVLSDIDKFNYLRGLLQRSALEAISGLALASYPVSLCGVRRFLSQPLRKESLVHSARACAKFYSKSSKN